MTKALKSTANSKVSRYEYIDGLKSSQFLAFTQRSLVVLVILFVGFILIAPLFEQNNQIGEYLDTVESSFDNSGTQALVPLPVSIEKKYLHADLGRRLYFDPLLSPKNISCSHCHDLKHYGTLPQALSPDIQSGYDYMNIPTILNAVLSGSLGWRGESSTLLEQLDHVVNNPKHMGSSWDYIVEKVNQDVSYLESFQKSFGEKPTQENIAIAIQDFEKSLVTIGAPFDRYLRGDVTAITDQQKEGYRLFTQYGCIACHQGVNVGGNLYAKYGLFEDPFAQKKSLSGIDEGRFLVTRNKADLNVFRVPSLRNVAETAPYLHDGSVSKLEEVVVLMGRYQLGQVIPRRDVVKIVDFLKSLTAPLPVMAQYE